MFVIVVVMMRVLSGCGDDDGDDDDGDDDDGCDDDGDDDCDCDNNQSREIKRSFIYKRGSSVYKHRVARDERGVLLYIYGIVCSTWIHIVS